MRFECGYLCVTEKSRLFYRFTVLAFDWKWEDHLLKYENMCIFMRLGLLQLIQYLRKLFKLIGR